MAGQRKSMKGAYTGLSRTTKWRKKINKHGVPEQIAPPSCTTDTLSSEYADIVDFEDVHEVLPQSDELTESEQPHEFDDVQTDEDKPLYEGCGLTVASSMLLIVTFALRHNLTGVALSDLLALIEIHCLADNLCRSTMSMYRQFFQTLKTPLIFNYYCESCYMDLGLSQPDGCSNCNGTVKHFLKIPTGNQLEKILSGPDVLQELKQTKESLRDRDGSIRDVYDGQLYKDHFNTSGYFQGCSSELNELHLSLQVNTDGAALFRSSKFSVWPLYAVINELPPKKRYTRDNRLFLGLWFGYQKPNMKLFLGSLLNEFHSLFEGVSMTITSVPTKVRAIIISSVADAPARCLMSEMVQFNGNFGCPCCYSRGETCFLSERGKSHIYPFETDQESGHAQTRTHKDTLKYAAEVERNYLNGKRREVQPIMGVKGVSMMSFLPKFDIIRGQSIDYMHCVLLGLVKMMISLWVGADTRNEKWSLYSMIETVNMRLKNMAPNRLISRMPRGIDNFGDWKASEFRTFLIFYSLPVLYDILPPEFLAHFTHLVIGTYLLLKSCIMKNDLDKASYHFKKFNIGLDKLYGERYCTFNAHSLLHLVSKVKDLGPLWAHSCFFYESLNGDLRKQFHGTQQAEMQIVTAVCIQQKLPQLIEKEKDGAVQALLQQMTKRSSLKFSGRIGNASHILGPSSDFVPPTNIAHILTRIVGAVFKCAKFLRVYQKGFVFCSKSYKAVKKRNSFTAKWEEGFCEIQYFIKCGAVNGYRYFAIIKELNECSENLFLSCHIKKVIYGKIKVIDISQLEEPLMYMCSDSKQFVAQFPNFVEKD